MTKNDFLQLVAERLQIADENLTVETNIKDLDEWDSWNALELMTLVDETFQVNLTAEDIKEITTFQTLIDKIGKNKFE
jgi:Phosphopantetheine attachment site.